jgi:hypothetical protein
MINKNEMTPKETKSDSDNHYQKKSDEAKFERETSAEVPSEMYRLKYKLGKID